MEKILYTYSELKEEARGNAKEVIRECLKESRDTELFTRGTIEDIKNNYCMFDVELNYSLGCCQGDGLSFTGSIDIVEFIEKYRRLIKENFTTSDIESIISIAEYDTPYIDITRTNFSYYHRNSTSFEYAYCIEEDNVDLAYKFLDFIEEFIKEQYDVLEAEGYNYFYNVEDLEVIDYIKCNDIEFTKEGYLY